MARLATRPSRPTARKGRYSRNQPGVLGAAEGPPSVELEVPQVRHQERDRRVHVVPADVEVGQRQVPRHAVRIGAELVADDDDHHVDQHARTADQAEPEEEQPVLFVPDQQVVTESLHDETKAYRRPAPSPSRPAAPDLRRPPAFPGKWAQTASDTPVEHVVRAQFPWTSGRRRRGPSAARGWTGQGSTVIRSDPGRRHWLVVGQVGSERVEVDRTAGQASALG